MDSGPGKSDSRMCSPPEQWGHVDAMARQHRGSTRPYRRRGVYSSSSDGKDFLRARPPDILDAMAGFYGPSFGSRRMFGRHSE